MKDYLAELKAIEDELLLIWKSLSPSEKQNRPVVQKMNRIRMTIHRLRSANGKIQNVSFKCVSETNKNTEGE